LSDTSAIPREEEEKDTRKGGVGERRGRQRSKRWKEKDGEEIRQTGKEGVKDKKEELFRRRRMQKNRRIKSKERKKGIVICCSIESLIGKQLVLLTFQWEGKNSKWVESACK